MASKLVKSVNTGYAGRYQRKSSKGQGIYATGLPGTPNGVHITDRKVECRCGRCNANKEEV